MMHRIESQGLLFATKHFSLRQNRISLAFVVALTSAACEREEAKRESAKLMQRRGPFDRFSLTELTQTHRY